MKGLETPPFRGNCAIPSLNFMKPPALRFAAAAAAATATDDDDDVWLMVAYVRQQGVSNILHMVGWRAHVHWSVQLGNMLAQAHS